MNSTTKSVFLEEATKYDECEDYVRYKGKPLYHKINNLFGVGFCVCNKEKDTTEIYVPYYDKNKFKLYSPRQYNTVEKTAQYLGVAEDTLKKTTDGILPKLDYSNTYTTAVKNKGYQGVYIGRGKNGTEAVVFDPEFLKTKSQLEDIWKQANKSALPKSKK